ncbi:hypothetical protein [Delftia acidovorans]
MDIVASLPRGAVLLFGDLLSLGLAASLGRLGLLRGDESVSVPDAVLVDVGVAFLAGVADVDVTGGLQCSCGTSVVEMKTAIRSRRK